MTALADKRITREERWAYHLFPLGAGKKAFQGGLACLDTSSGHVVPGVAASATLVPIGEFAENIDNSAGGSTVNINVKLAREVVVHWFDNDPGAGAITSANVGSDAYVLDDHSVTITATGNSKVGRIWKVDARLGVAVEMLPTF